MTSSNGTIFPVTGPLGGEFTGHWWIPLTKASNEELWCFLWSAPEQTLEQAIETPVIWDAIVLIMIMGNFVFKMSIALWRRKELVIMPFTIVTLQLHYWLSIENVTDTMHDDCFPVLLSSFRCDPLLSMHDRCPHPCKIRIPLQWRHNERDGVSNRQPHDSFLNLLFMRRSKKTSKLRVTGLCAGNSPMTGEFPAQRASNAENVSIWWRHHIIMDQSQAIHNT